jgi:hypothetical protein
MPVRDARVAVWGSILSIVLSIVYLKDHHRERECEEGGNNVDSSIQDYSQNGSVVQSIKRTVSYLQNPLIGPLLFIKLLNGVSSSAFSTILPLILANKLNFSAAELGYYMSVNSFTVAVFACVGIGPSMKICGDRADGLAFWGVVFRSVSLVIFALAVARIISTGVDSEASLNNLWKRQFRQQQWLLLVYHLHRMRMLHP